MLHARVTVTARAGQGAPGTDTGDGAAAASGQADKTAASRAVTMTAGALHVMPGAAASRGADQTATVTWFAVTVTAGATHVTLTTHVTEPAGPGAAGWRDSTATMTVTVTYLAVTAIAGATHGDHAAEAGAWAAGRQRDWTGTVP